MQFFHSTYINYKKKKNSGSSWSDQGDLQRGCLKKRKERFCFLPVLDTKLYSMYAWSKSGDQNLVKTCVKLFVQRATLCYDRAINALWSGFSHRAQIIQVWNCEGSGKATQQKWHILLGHELSWRVGGTRVALFSIRSMEENIKFLHILVIKHNYPFPSPLPARGSLS